MTPYYSESGIQIFHGDCREVLPQLERVDLILTDPPYGVDLEYADYRDTEASWFDLLDKAIPIMRDRADMVIMPSCQIKRLGWFYRNHEPDWIIAWHKGSPGHVSAVGFNDWEPLVVWGRTRGLSMHDHLSVNNDERMGAYGHPCPKPLRWAKWIVSRACPDAGCVIDPFMGSGTTMRAAKDCGVRGIGIELSERYCEIAANRLRQGVLFGTEGAA
jgi:site-specific DNA-methyltransferase (adenine-specific)